jgi:hypothetical protein
MVPVATFPNAEVDVKYGILPTTPADDVERPLHPREPEPKVMKEPLSGPVGVRVEVATP